MVLFQREAASGLYRIVLTPNCSISWPQLVRVYLFICLTSFCIALMFAFFGFWVILPFSGLEMLALGVALYLTNRMVFCKEVISSLNGVVKIEKGCKYPDQRWEFDQYWVQIKQQKESDFSGKTLIFIGSHGKFVELGGFLDETEKESLVFALNEGIILSGFLGKAV